MASSVSSIVTASWAGVAGVAGVGVGLRAPGVADPGVVGARCIIAGEETKFSQWETEDLCLHVVKHYHMTCFTYKSSNENQLKLGYANRSH